MRTHIVLLGIITGVAAFLCGCGDSKPTTPSTQADTPAATPVAPAEAAAAATAPVQAAVAEAKTAAADVTAQFVSMAKSQADSQLGTIGGDLAAKVQALVSSAAGNENLKSQLSGSMQSLAGGNDAAGLTSLFQTAKEASLTPQQQELAKEVGSLASAYVVQKNFASLEGSQSDVAAIVNSLRQGQYAQALPSLQKVGQNASLTTKQKELLSSLSQQYAPDLGKAAGALQQGLQGLQKLQGSGK